VKNGTQNAERGERGIDVQAHDHIFVVWGCAGEGELWDLLGVYTLCQLMQGKHSDR
jgi:hypothetical protein